MSDYGRKRAKAAKWMWENKQDGHWWRWQVLTKKNPNKSPELSDHDASLIFADFTQAGMLLPVIASDGQGAHAIHEGKSTEWDAAAHPWRWWFRQHLFWILGFLVTSIASAIIGLLVGMWLPE